MQFLKPLRKDTKMNNIIFAIGNKVKIREIREIMADLDVEILSM